MINSISFNPIATTNAAGSFSTTTEGWIQGTALQDPAIRNQLAGGYLDPAETIPMWGGVGVSVQIPGAANTPQVSYGPSIKRATNVTAAAALTLAGFSVFDQDHAMLTSPQQQVPVALSYNSVHFYRLGSDARIIVKCDPALLTLEGGIEGAQVSWDFGAQQLCPFVAAYPANVFTALTRALVGGTYVATATTTTAHGIAVGDDITVSGQTPTAYNGNWKAIAGTAGSTLVWNTGLTADPGASTVLGQVNAGGGALPVKVLQFNTNSMTIDYNPATGAITWNRQGTAAAILI